jgi:hypothetical protein
MMNHIIVLPIPQVGMIEANERLWHLSADTESEIFALAAVYQSER